MKKTENYVHISTIVCQYTLPHKINYYYYYYYYYYIKCFVIPVITETTEIVTKGLKNVCEQY